MKQKPVRAIGFPTYDRTYPGYDRVRVQHGIGCVYILVDPRDLAVHYVGQTRNARARYASHARPMDEGNFALRSRKQELADAGLRHRMIVVEQTDHDLDALEVRWIAYYRRLGRICNVHRGGTQRRRGDQAARNLAEQDASGHADDGRVAVSRKRLERLFGR